MMIIRAGVSALLVAAIVPRNAAADREGREEGMSVQMLGNLGLALPGGDIGGEAELFLHPRFSLGLGLGLAIGGTQVASTVRLRPLRRRMPGADLSLGSGLGYSTGDYEHWTLLAGTATFPATSWINLDAFVELRADIGFVVRGMFGWSWPVASGECSFDESGFDSDLCEELDGRPPQLPYVGVALGWSFGSRP
jgi:hypothetical protein